MQNEHSTDNAAAAKAALRRLFEQAFLEHPKAAGETYWQHFAFTISMATRLGLCSMALIIHGIFPFLFVHTTSNKMKKANAILRARADKTMEAMQDSNWII